MLTRTLVFDEVRPRHTGLYTCRATRSDGLVQVSSVGELLVQYRPVISVQPSERTTLLPGSPLVLSMAAHGEPSPAFKWEFNGLDIPSATTATLTLNSVTKNDAGVYVGVAYNTLGTRRTQDALLLVHEAPTFLLQPQNATADPGADLTLTASVLGSPFPAMQWWRNGSKLDGQIFPTLVFRGIQKTDQGFYTLTLDNTAGAAISNVVSVTVNDPPSLVAPLPTTLRVNLGANLTLAVNVQGTAPLLFQWYKDNVEVPGATTAELNIRTMTVTSVGGYTVHIANSAGALTAGPTQVVANIPPRLVNLDFIALPVYRGDRIILLATVTGDPVPMLQWLAAGQVLASHATPRLDYAVETLGSTVFSIRIENEAGVLTEQVVTVNVGELPPNALPPGTPLQDATSTCKTLTRLHDCELCLNSSVSAYTDCAYCVGGTQAGCMAGLRHQLQSRYLCEQAGGTWIAPATNRDLCPAIHPIEAADEPEQASASSNRFWDMDLQRIIYVAGAGTIFVLLVATIVLVVRCHRHRRVAKDLQRHKLQHNLNRATIASPNLAFRRLEPKLREQLQHYFYIDQDDHASAEEAVSLAPAQPRIIAPRSVHVLELIGSGHFGDVYSGELVSASSDDSFEVIEAQAVALKLLAPKYNNLEPTVAEMQDFLREAALLAQFQHPSLSCHTVFVVLVLFAAYLLICPARCARTRWDCVFQ